MLRKECTSEMYTQTTVLFLFMALSFSPPFLVFSLLRSIFHVVESISILSSVFSSHLLRKTLSAHITLAVLCLFLFLYKSLSPPHSLYLIALLMFCAPSNSFSHALTSLSLSLSPCCTLSFPPLLRPLPPSLFA